jgi:hypothetical protein
MVRDLGRYFWILEYPCQVSHLSHIGRKLMVTSALGLSTLFAMPDLSLRAIMVRGDLIINEDNRDSMCNS